MRLTQNIYDFLDVGKSPHPSDCIFVLAGDQKRKVYGVKMWRFGYASQLILSVGRFEWRKFSELNLPSDGGLVSLVDHIPPEKRHFLVHLDCQQAFATAVHKGFWGTRSEARAMADYLRDKAVRTLLVVSSPAHLRRVALAFRRAFRRNGIRLTFVAVPENLSFDSPSARAPIWSELRKYLFYRLILLF
jgi:hypothetical protein